jgi:hypothetical protein
MKGEITVRRKMEVIKKTSIKCFAMKTRISHIKNKLK